MARPLRLELSGGIYHVTARGDGRDDVYLTDADRIGWLEVLPRRSKRRVRIAHADKASNVSAVARHQPHPACRLARHGLGSNGARPAPIHAPVAP